MGTDKAVLEVRGVPMLGLVAGVLRMAGAKPVVQVGGAARAGVELTVVPDAVGGAGPMGGVLAALRWSIAPRVVIAACDLPDLTASTVRRLIRASWTSQAPVVAAWTGRWEPLCSVWSVRVALPEVEAAVASGDHALHRVIEVLGGHRVEVAADELRNVNTPDDLAHG